MNNGRSPVNWVEPRCFEWWPGTESNCRHRDFQSPALPTELPGHLGSLLPPNDGAVEF